MLPDFRRLNKEDFEDAPNWVDKLLTSLNAFMESTYNILNKNISLTDNLNFQVYKTSFETLATYTNGDFNPLSFSKTVKGRVIGIIVGQIKKEDGSSLDTAVYPHYDVSNNMVQISYIAGLDNSTKYNTILVAIGEN